MSEEIVTRSYYEPVVAIVRSDHENYKITIGDKEIKMSRNVDFGKYGQAQRPSLLKSGAEKIVITLGMETKYEIEKAEEDFESGFFFYRVKCSLYKNGYHITDGYGSANSREKACGRMAGYDAANQRLKLAKKRALVDAALMVANLSGAFFADLEDSVIEDGNVLNVAQRVVKSDEPISQKQVKRMFTLCSRNAVDTDKANEIIAKYGYKSSKEIKQKDYDAICNDIENFGIVDAESVEVKE